MSRAVLALRLLLSLGVPAVATIAQAQMTEEVAALHRSLFERPPNQTAEDATLYRELALRYLYGRGVERDVVQGCALLWRADGAARSPRHDQSGIDKAEALLAQHCKGLSADDYIEMGYVSGCGFIGLERQILSLGPDSWVEFSRLGIAIDRPSGRIDHRFAGAPTCQRQVMLLRTVLNPREGRNQGESHFIEMLSWHTVGTKQGLRRELEWNLFGVGESDLQTRAYATLLSEKGSLWPRPAVPDRFREGALLTVSSSGELQWEFPGDPPLIGTIR